MIDPALQLTAALTLALVFAAAALSKINAWSEFEGVVRNYRVLPGPLVPVVTWVLPPIELLIAALLVWPPTRSLGALAALALLAVFCVAIGVNLLRGRTEIDCGCFRAKLKQGLSWWLVLRNGVLALFALALLAADVPRDLVLIDYLTALAGAGALFLAYLSVGYVTLKAPPRFDEIAEARAAAAAEAARLSTQWKTL